MTHFYVVYSNVCPSIILSSFVSLIVLRFIIVIWEYTKYIRSGQIENKTLSEATFQIWRPYVADYLYNIPNNVAMLNACLYNRAKTEF